MPFIGALLQTAYPVGDEDLPFVITSAMLQLSRTADRKHAVATVIGPLPIADEGRQTLIGRTLFRFRRLKQMILAATA